jgi:hypothetical protein
MAKRTTTKEEYFLWLYSLVDTHRKTSYIKLCRELHKIPFTWFVPNDDNRCSDGLSLRDEFIELRGLDETHLEVEYLLKGECTFFEMLVGLARRMEFTMYDLNPNRDKTPRWFMELIHNLGFNEHDDSTSREELLDEMVVTKIFEKVDTVLSRQYDFFGTGSLFPLKKRPPKDMSRVELWYQLMYYLEENYG